MAESRKVISKNKAFSEDYIETMFLAWYKSGRPAGMEEIINAAPADEYGRVPTPHAVKVWKAKYGWDSRANAMDIEVRKRAESGAIQEKVEMFNRQAEYGKNLQKLGFDFFTDNKVKSEKTALQMIRIGAEIEARSRGVSQAIIKIAEMDNSKLTSTINSILQSYSEEEVKEVIKILDEDTVEGEVSEIDG